MAFLLSQNFFWLHIQEEVSLLTILKGANSFLPQVVIASTILALVYPPSFNWFTNRFVRFLKKTDDRVSFMACSVALSSEDD